MAKGHSSVPPRNPGIEGPEGHLRPFGGEGSDVKGQRPPGFEASEVDEAQSFEDPTEGTLASLLLVLIRMLLVMPFVTSSDALAPSSVLVTSSKALWHQDWRIKDVSKWRHAMGSPAVCPCAILINPDSRFWIHCPKRADRLKRVVFGERWFQPSCPLI